MSVKKIRTGIIGCGGITHYHLRNMLKDKQTEIVVLCDPSQKSLESIAGVFEAEGMDVPPSRTDLTQVLMDFDLDAVLIATPHALHHDHTSACLEAGVDVLLEKPMVVNTEEALSLIKTRDTTGQTLVIAFQGSLSPLVRQASAGLLDQRYGELLSVSATVWQNWGPNTSGTWRQKPALSGGGFIFDTGAHMLNTVADLVNQAFVEVAAWMDNRGRPVETISVAMAKLASGAYVTLHGCGETVPSCSSVIKVFCKDAILTTGAWGRFLQIEKTDQEEPEDVPFPLTSNTWDTFLKVRSGEIPNPSPPEVGLRMIRLYDAICQSAAEGGRIVKIER